MSVATLLAAGIGGMGAGTSLLSAFSTYNQGQFAKEVAGRQAQALGIQAQQVEQQAGADIAQQDYKANRIIGAMRAATGASGIAGEGSPAVVTAESEHEAELNDMYAKYAANLQATNLYYSGQVGVTEAQNQAQAATIAAISGGTTGAINAGIDAYALKTRADPYGYGNYSDALLMNKFGGVQ